jgi:hypothetical protein
VARLTWVLCRLERTSTIRKCRGRELGFRDGMVRCRWNCQPTSRASYPFSQFAFLGWISPCLLYFGGGSSGRLLSSLWFVDVLKSKPCGTRGCDLVQWLPHDTIRLGYPLDARDSDGRTNGAASKRLPKDTDEWTVVYGEFSEEHDIYSFRATRDRRQSGRQDVQVLAPVVTKSFAG